MKILQWNVSTIIVLTHSDQINVHGYFACNSKAELQAMLKRLYIFLNLIKKKKKDLNLV